MKGQIVRPDPNRSNLNLPRIGFIRTGIKVSGEKEGEDIPQSVDYFVAAGKYASYFDSAFGEKPNSIQIAFMTDDVLESCFERYEYRDEHNKIYARGDGETFEVWNSKLGIYEEFDIKKNPQIMRRVEKRVKSEKGWEVILTLRFIIPAISNIIGYWEYTTRAEASTIPNVTGTFNAILQNRKTVVGLPFDLNVEYATSQKPDSKDRYPVVSLVANTGNSEAKVDLWNFEQFEPEPEK